MSAIDRFIEKRQELASLYPSQTSPLINNPTFGSLILLGLVSAVESYCREIIRRTIVIDKRAQRNCAAKTLAYGAALIHVEEMLPEALLEETSFSSRKAIKKALSSFLAIGDVSPAVDQALLNFEQICHLRHCAVHRFGRMGVKQAIALGIDQHRDCVEKPLALSFGNVQTCIAMADSLVRELNYFLVNKILEFSISQGIWHWHYGRDRKLFSKYFTLYYSSLEPPNPPLQTRDAYNAFRAIGKQRSV